MSGTRSADQVQILSLQHQLQDLKYQKEYISNMIIKTEETLKQMNQALKESEGVILTKAGTASSKVDSPSVNSGARQSGKQVEKPSTKSGKVNKKEDKKEEKKEKKTSKSNDKVEEHELKEKKEKKKKEKKEKIVNGDEGAQKTAPSSTRKKIRWSKTDSKKIEDYLLSKFTTGKLTDNEKSTTLDDLEKVFPARSRWSIQMKLNKVLAEVFNLEQGGEKKSNSDSNDNEKSGKRKRDDEDNNGKSKKKRSE